MAGKANEHAIPYFSTSSGLTLDDCGVISDVGFDGIGILTTIKQELFNSGYYLEWNNKRKKLYCRLGRFEIERLDNIINTLLDLEFFNIDIYNKYNILTSEDIQENYFTATYRRASVRIENDYWLFKQSALERWNIELHDKGTIIKNAITKKEWEKQQSNNASQNEQPLKSVSNTEQPLKSVSKNGQSKSKSKSKSNISLNDEKANSKKNHSSSLEINKIFKAPTLAKLYDEFFKVDKSESFNINQSNLRERADAFFAFYDSKDWHYPSGNKMERLDTAIKKWLNTFLKSKPNNYNQNKPIPMQANNYNAAPDDFISDAGIV